MATGNDVIERFRLACRVGALFRQPDSDAKLRLIEAEEGYSASTLRSDRHVPQLLTEEDLRHELSRNCANGRPLRWSHFVALGPLAGMPREQGNRLAIELLDQARQGNLGARWLANQARRIVRRHKEAVETGFPGDAADGHRADDLDRLTAEVADLRRDVQKLRQIVGIGHARTPTDDDRCSPGVPGRPDGPAAHTAPGAHTDLAGETSS